MSDEKKKIRIIAIVLPAILLLAAAAAGLFFWYMPRYWQQSVENSYLLPNRSVIRVGSVQPGAFNRLLLKNVEIGSADARVFAAPSAELICELDPRKSFDRPRISRLCLKNSRLNIDSVKGNIRINNVMLPELVKQISALPAGPNGEAVTLEVSAAVQVGNAKPASNIQLVFARDKQGKLKISAELFALNGKKLSCKWSAVIDPANNSMVFFTMGSIPTVFLQEILLRANVPAAAVSVVRAADFSGKGSFSASYPALKINNFDLTGKLTMECLRFYKYDFKKVAPFDIFASKTPQNFEVRIPEISISSKGNVYLQSVMIKHSFRRPVITLDAKCNIQQNLLNILFFADNKESKNTVSELPDKLHGSWNTQNGKWQFVCGEPSAAMSNIQLDLPGIKASLQPEKFSFKVYGTKSAGTAVQDLHFKDLNIYLAQKSDAVKAAAGYINSTSHFGMSDRPDQHLLHYQFSNFSAANNSGEISLPEFSGKVELRSDADDKINIFAAANGKSSKAVTGKWNLDMQHWRLTADIDWYRSEKRREIKSMNCQIDEFVFDHPKYPLKLADVLLQAQVKLQNREILQSKISLKSRKAISGGSMAEKLALDLDWDQASKSGNKLRMTATADNADARLNKDSTVQAINCSVALTGSGITMAPEKIRISSDTIKLVKPTLNAAFRNSKWQIDRHGSKEWNINSSFAAAQYDTRRKVFGNGSSGKGSLAVNIVFSDTAEKDYKVNALADIAQAACQYGDFHASGEQLQGSLLYQSDRQPSVQGNVLFKNANVLGRHFTAAAGKMDLNFSAEKSDHIAGSITIANSTINDVHGNLEMRHANVKLPFLAAGKAPRSFPKGSFSAAEIYLNGEKFGSIQAELEHFFLLPANLTAPGKHQLTLRGKLRPAKFNNVQSTLEGTWQLPPGEESFKWNYSMPEAKLTEPLYLKKYLPGAWDAALLRGNYIVEASGVWRSSSPAQGSIRLHSINSDWQIGSISAEGVTASSNITISGNNLQIQPHDVSIGKLSWQKWLMNDNELKLSLNNDLVMLSGWQGRLLKGVFRATQVINLDAPAGKQAQSQPVQFSVKDLPANDFFSQLGISCIKSSAKLEGSLQCSIKNNALCIDRSDLEFNSPSGELLAIELKNPSSIRMRDVQYRNFALAVLRSMKCNSAKFSVTADPAVVNMRIKAEGAPAAAVPFVYQGRGAGSPFRKVRPGEHGFDGEIELNVNLKLHPENPGV